MMMVLVMSAILIITMIRLLMMVAWMATTCSPHYIELYCAVISN